MSTTSSSNQSWLVTVMGLLRHNGAVMLAGESVSEAEGPVPTYLARLLDFDDRGFLIERPQGKDAIRFMREGSPIFMLLIDGSQRLELASIVTELTRYQLNERMTVAAARLAMPHDVRSAQRRNYFRVMVSGLKLNPVTFIPPEVSPEAPAEASPEADPAPPEVSPEAEVRPEPTPESSADAPQEDQPIEVRPFEAKLLNLGGGGVGVEAPRWVRQQLPLCDTYHCRLTLPDIEDVITVVGKVVHCRPQQQDTVYLGVQFEFDDPAQESAVVDQLVRFTTVVQRRQLRHQRRQD